MSIQGERRGVSPTWKRASQTRRAYASTLALVLAFVMPLHADEKLAGKACRSVHLGYPGPEAIAYYNEVTVEQSARGTYFCVCGFNKGYFGIQELGNGKKVAIFSVWEPGKQNDPKSVPDDRKVKVLHEGPGVTVKRFGNEGTGGQSFYDLDWKLNETYRFLVTARADGERTAYAGFIYLPEKKEWLHMATFSTLAGGKKLAGYYSFIEDFRRNGTSLTEARKARFGGGWIGLANETWQPLTKARFTGDSNPATNIDAGPIDGRFFLATGGPTVNKGAKLNESMEAPASPMPKGLPIK